MNWTRTEQAVAIVAITPWLTTDDERGVLLVGTEVEVSGWVDEDGKHPFLRLHSIFNPNLLLSKEATARCRKNDRLGYRINSAKWAKESHDIQQKDHMDRFEKAVERLRQHGMVRFEEYWRKVEGAS